MEKERPVQVVGVGMACLDLLVRTKELPTWERGARLNAMAIEGGGPVATAMVTVKRLGVSSGMVGIYGSDRLGEIKLRTLTENKVDVSRMIRRPGPESHAVLVSVHEETGERVFSGMNGQPEFLPLSEDELDRGYITGAAYLHLDGCNPKAALQAARWMHEAGKPVMLDGSATNGPISAEIRALVAEVDIIICGSGFGAALTGKKDLWDAGSAMLDMGPKIVVQTEGADGSYTVSRDECFHTPAFPVEVIDTTGAGDVFHGAYLVGLLRGWTIREIAQFSSAVAAMKCTRLGGRPGIPSFEQAIDFLVKRGTKLKL